MAGDRDSELAVVIEGLFIYFRLIYDLIKNEWL